MLHSSPLALGCPNDPAGPDQTDRGIAGFPRVAFGVVAQGDRPLVVAVALVAAASAALRSARQVLEPGPLVLVQQVLVLEGQQGPQGAA